MVDWVIFRIGAGVDEAERQYGQDEMPGRVLQRRPVAATRLSMSSEPVIVGGGITVKSIRPSGAGTMPSMV